MRHTNLSNTDSSRQPVYDSPRRCPLAIPQNPLGTASVIGTDQARHKPENVEKQDDVIFLTCVNPERTIGSHMQGYSNGGSRSTIWTARASLADLSEVQKLSGPRCYIKCHIIIIDEFHTSR